MSKLGRLMSLDALRGLDMFWIVGGDRIIRGVAKASDIPVLNALARQFSHVEWEGFRFYDLIFPLFLFMIGVSIPYAFERRLERGEKLRSIYRHILLRVVTLFILGLMVNGNLLTYDIGKIQIYSVLQMLALGYFFASVFYLHMGWQGQLAVTVLMLAGYWALLAFVPGPGHVIGEVAPQCNVGDWLNDLLLGAWQGRFRFGWILATLGHASTAMLGVFAARVLRSARLTPYGKFKWLGAMGAVCLLAGIVWGGWLARWLPGLELWGVEWNDWPIWSRIIKRRWTSGYVLYAGGWSYLMLASFYLVIDVWGARRWCRPFVVIGTQALFAYMVCMLGRKALNAVAGIFLNGLAQYTGAWQEPLTAAGAFAVLWFLLWHVDRFKRRADLLRDDFKLS